VQTQKRVWLALSQSKVIPVELCRSGTCNCQRTTRRKKSATSCAP
jgi:hypothetical protein